MNEDQEQKCHICRFCKQSFSNGKKLGGHMRRHLALIAACRKMGNDQESQESVNGEKGLDGFENDDQMIKKSGGEKQSVQETDQGDVNDVMIKKSQQEVEVDQDCKGNNVYVLRENPKRSWRVSNSSKGYCNIVKKRCDSRKESMKLSVCEKCGKSFNSVKALYGHMRCHSVRRSKVFDEPSVMTSSMEHDHDGCDDGEVATPVRKKRSCTRYKSPKPNDHITRLSSFDDDDEVEKGAICLMMLSMGVRDLDEVKLVISSQARLMSHQRNVEFEVSVDGSMGLKKDLIFGTGSGQVSPGRAGSTLVKYKSVETTGSFDKDFGDMDATDSDISLELKRRSKAHNCPICLKEFGSVRALGCHKRVHANAERKVKEKNHDPDVHRLVNPDLDFFRGVSTMVLWGP
ncbi:putative transcription factor C2H2 family [Helianthus annuus]|uniref:Putative zinc finger C2H2-type/integrase DNA-binding domain-containing protein n=1 Tax=Helianthus annuus TaxID=4232 RepID=A0A251RP87_HELAN|nr:putative transcription factor C2H2 family [Helianthus annuus]KAJ0447096.1 putative transcription factor C2H2 family [Helianthus annuus]KAJ0632001.1 putative transcription factor C2H2 family [Helianthus annuus]KAJ0825803.1 putative transcription factor C2H2 family [Helianthus annuus]